MLKPNTWIRIAIPLVKGWQIPETRWSWRPAPWRRWDQRNRYRSGAHGQHMLKPTSRFLPGLIFSENESISGPPVVPITFMNFGCIYFHFRDRSHHLNCLLSPGKILHGRGGQRWILLILCQSAPTDGALSCHKLHGRYWPSRWRRRTWHMVSAVVYKVQSQR